MVPPLPISSAPAAQQEDQHKNQACIATRWLVFVEIVELRLGILGQAKERRPVYSLGRGWLLVNGTSIAGRGGGGNVPQGRFGCDGRVRERGPAHAAESVLWTVIVPAMRAADVHSFKHSSIFGWQKGCCCW